MLLDKGGGGGGGGEGKMRNDGLLTSFGVNKVSTSPDVE